MNEPEIPSEVYLQHGGEFEDDWENVSWCEVTWAAARVFPSDLKYVEQKRLDKAHEFIYRLSSVTSASLNPEHTTGPTPHPDHQQLADYIMSECMKFLEGENRDHNQREEPPSDASGSDVSTKDEGSGIRQSERSRAEASYSRNAGPPEPPPACDLLG